MATKNVKAVVAPRKTVMFEGKYVGPGGEVTLPIDEAQELWARGFLVDPDGAAAPAPGPGPSFGITGDGPTVTETA